MDTSKKVYEMTKDISAMSISAKEASRLADQISQMLHLISSFSETAQKIESLSINVKALALDSQGEPTYSRRLDP